MTKQITASSPSSLQPLIRLLAHARYVFGALLVLTAALLVWHHYGMEREVDLAAGQFPISVGDDRGGGKVGSVGQLERHGRDVIMHCEMVRKNSWPFCRLMFDLHNGEDGVDFSSFTSMAIDASYQGPDIAKLRVSLINAEPGMSRPEDWKSYKVNEVTGLLIPRSGSLDVPMGWFSVAQWWKELANPAREHSFTRFDNVVRVEVSTPVEAQAGEHLYVIHSLRFRGKLISEKTLLMGLVALWMIAAIAWPAAAALTLRQELARSKAAVSLLTQLNNALQLETRELAGQVHIDPLTGVLNRQGLRATLMNTSTMLTAPMSVIFMDIDHFKNINDSHGHDLGDAVLRQFAQAITSVIRSSDKLVRWGGEEFLIVCPMTDVHHATALAEKLRAALHRQPWPAGLAVTASFGVAQHDAADEIGVAIKRADTELYAAKANGRDRVHAYAPQRPR